MIDKEKVGKTIALYRKMRGLTQKNLADMLHISYQAVSKWEAGVSLPSVEMLYEVAVAMNVIVDSLLNDNIRDNRWISYMDTGLDTKKLYALKREIQELVSPDEELISAQFADATIFKIDTSGMKEPVYASLNCVPGSKERYAREHGYDEEICADVAANAMNFVLQHGMKPVILQAMVLCGNNGSDQLYRMAQTFQRVCVENNVMFAGMEIAAQPVNYRQDEYRVSASLVAVQDREKLQDLSHVSKGDILIGIRTEGINGTNYPIIKVMMDRKPELAYAKIDEEHYFVEEMMKPNTAFTKEVMELQGENVLQGVFLIRNHLLNDRTYLALPEGVGACIDLRKVPILPLYRFLAEQDLIGRNVLPYHFHFGIGMMIAVKEKDCERAMEIIGKTKECWCIGRIERNTQRNGEKVWTIGELAL
ncbi:MAG: helix-turn-helix domain-containing protein [Lachnospiraceae bacterium]|nr:helix-turn-helix domain-containing protein [Lachnospiraceae bacterium]